MIQRYSLLPFMTPRQFFYPRVVLEFCHTMTSRGVPSQLQLQFSIDGRPGVLRAADITVALGLPVVLANSTDYRQWPQPSPREMVCSLARDTTAGHIPRGPRTLDQPVPTSALCTVQGSYTRGSVPDIRGVLVQPHRACHDRPTTLRGEGPP